MIHQILLRKVVQGRDSCLVEFVDKIAPGILERFANIAALGGSEDRAFPNDLCLPDGLKRYENEELERFSKGFDQSMVTHILNGIFVGFRIAELLPKEKSLSELEKKLWLLGYLLHDYTKIYGIKVKAGELDNIRKIIICLGDELNFGKFLPDWTEYLDDLVFIAQNTQKVDQANLNLRDFNSKTDIRRLDVLRLLSSYSDVLVHVKSPSQVLLPSFEGDNTAYNLRETLNSLFGGHKSPTFFYHKLTEVKGLLSNIINNSIMEELKNQGLEPYLFFPNGVVYLAHNDNYALNSVKVADTVWEKITETISDSETFGIRRAGTGFTPSSTLYEAKGIEGVLMAGKRKAMTISQGYALTRLYGFFTGMSKSDIKKTYGDDKKELENIQKQLVDSHKLIYDLRIDRLGEFLTLTYRTVRDILGKKKQDQIISFLLDKLGLSGDVSIEEANKQKGGTCFGWFYVSSVYLNKNRGLDDNGIDLHISELISETVEWFQNQRYKKKKNGKVQLISEAIKNYTTNNIELNGKLFGTSGEKEIFALKLSKYVGNKDKRKPICSLCSSHFKTLEQEQTDVPFINQQYSNKNPLGIAKLIRGICPVCRVEMILRLIHQERLDESKKPISLYLFPTYFFTPETALVVKLFINRLKDIDIWDLRKYLREKGFFHKDIIHYDAFIIEEEPKTLNLPKELSKPKYSEHDFAGMFFFSTLTSGKKPTDTKSWINPALLSLAIPLILNVKVVSTPSFIPIYTSGSDFRQTVILDSPHQFIRHILRKDRFRVDETDKHLIKLLELYDLHLDIFSKSGDPNWNQINSIVKDIATDPYYVFAYYDKRRRKEESKRIPQSDVNRYIEIYQQMGGDSNMGIIGEIVDLYAKFYRASNFSSTYNILKPLNLAMDIIVKSDTKTMDCDLKLFIAGPIYELMQRIRDTKAVGIGGIDPIWIDKTQGTPKERLIKSQQSIETFVQGFIEKVFKDYCSANRAILNERKNLIRSAAHFHYLKNYSGKIINNKKEESHE